MNRIAAPATRTTILSVQAPFDLVFGYLADIENLPRWAGGFCECLELRRGRWVALTSLGELFLGLEADAPSGEVAFFAGWEPMDLHRLPMTISRDADGGSRVRFALGATAPEAQGRFYRALETELPELVTRLNSGVSRCEVGCAA